MKITIDQNNIIESYPYLEVGSRMTDHNTLEVFQRDLPIIIGEYECNEANIDLLIVASDLQGIAVENGEYFLLGEKLPAFLKTLFEIENIQRDKVGVVLCGDLFTSLAKRGSSGDVRKVWNAFNYHFNWVVGVAGNHDTFGSKEEKEQFKAKEGIHLLHQNTVELDGLKFGGISGIIGRADKTNRVSEFDFLKSLSKLSQQKLDMILIHETPDNPQYHEIGNKKIREHILKIDSNRFVCGHCHWEKSLANLENKSQVLNVDSKVVLLKVISR
ncbi:metallophosphoesterase [Flammeovirga sp. SJP92]|uniref:metallophosphoesterase family protein n=1 Tax=Flammeovirga sp. SJP92 TaxID=1775430 RepID=UPI000787B5E3|nr:metallophosphoesterase [Flammeovirga sp. SJP92]KXX67853.1 hypothetical protein AVL50_25680 [Flammeovirga sp. SJP92]